MPLKGVGKVKRQLNSLQDVAKPAAKTMQSWLVLVGTEAAIGTPIDTSTLINSQFKSQETMTTLVKGIIGYSANYAIYTHNTKYPMNFRRSTARKEYLLLAIQETESVRATMLRLNIDDFIKGIS